MFIISDGNTSIRKYYKQAWNSVNIILLKWTTLFFMALNRSNFKPKKVYLWGILLHNFIQKKSAAEALRMLVETYGDHALSEITCKDWFRCLKNDNFFMFKIKNSLVHWKSLKTENWRHYFMKTHFRQKLNLENHEELITQRFWNVWKR